MATTYDKDGAYIEVTENGVVHRRSIRWEDCVVSVPDGSSLKIDSVYVNESDQLVLVLEDESEITVTGITDHGELTGLTDDDHTIYIKEKASGGLASEIPLHDHSEAAEAGQVAHDSLSGVTASQHHSRYADNEAKAAAVQSGAITDEVTKAPTHDAVYDVKQTADAALPAADRYEDSEAVSAMGVKADDNPLNHDKANVGGLYGINVETLDDDKTLTSGTDKMYQYLDEGGADRIITLDTGSASAGDRFIIRHNGVYNDTHYLQVKQAAIILDEIYAGAVKEFIFNGTNWRTRGIGTGENDEKKYSVSIGPKAKAYLRGIAIGWDARAWNRGVAVGEEAYGYEAGVGIGRGALGQTSGAAVGYRAEGYTYGAGIGYTAKGGTYGAAVGYDAHGYSRGAAVGHASRGYSYGVAIGKEAEGYNYGVAVGYKAKGYTYGVALGVEAEGHDFGFAVGYKANTNAHRHSIALGRYSECERVAETSTSIDGEPGGKNNVVQGRWERVTANNTPVEMFCGGYSTSRFTIRPSSVLAFEMTITARDNVANEVARYSVHDGLIKRDAAGNTTMVNCTVVTDYEDDAGWGVAVTADDTNEALIITVTGDATNPVQWAAVMNGVETHF